MLPQHEQPDSNTSAVDLHELSRHLKPLVSETRLRILISLSRHRANHASVNELALTLGIKRSCLSRHLAVLHHSGWIASVRNGRRIVYSLDRGVHLEAADENLMIRRVAPSGKTLTLTIDNPLGTALNLPSDE